MYTKSLKIILCSLLACTTLIAQTTGSIQGTIIDANLEESLPFATIILEKEGVQKSGMNADFDGKYHFSTIDSGSYDLIVSYMGYQTVKIENLLVYAGQTTKYDVELVAGQVLDEVVVQAYKIPLIELGSSSGGQTLGAADIKQMATRNVTSIIATTAGVHQVDRGHGANKSGSRKSSNIIMIDGAPQISEPEIFGKTSFDNKTSVKHSQQSKIPNINSEEYGSFVENGYQKTKKDAFSTFSIDVDRASYSNIRRFIDQSQQPPKDAVRIEEMVNYFDYKYESPTDEHPFAIFTEVSDCPWNKEAKLLKIGLQGKRINLETAPASNLVFLIDVSGSMGDANKLPLLKESLKLLINNMRDQDKMALVVYAGAAGLVQASTNDKNKLITALEALNSGGSTAGGAGINLAYQVAKENFILDGNNRVILATDGDFNVGVSGNGDLEKLIEEKRKDDIFLTVLGFGMGNYKDSKMEILADKGNGNYAYIDNIGEAKKTLVNEMGGTLYVIAKDVKIQLEFNAKQVQSYRLVGYENRMLKKQDFANDQIDAGELGAGHTVTALYELVLEPKGEANEKADLMMVNLRYKQPKDSISVLLQQPLKRKIISLEEASENFRFAASVAGFGMLLRDSKYKNDLTYAVVLDLAKGAKGEDKEGYRTEFIGMVKNVNSMSMHASK